MTSGSGSESSVRVRVDWAWMASVERLPGIHWNRTKGSMWLKRVWTSST